VNRWRRRKITEEKKKKERENSGLTNANVSLDKITYRNPKEKERE
jgi:hypothetical protein